jgi:Fur family ferric uptake transcriptional regulator
MAETEFEAALLKAGLRVTRQRLAVLESLAARSGLVTAQELYTELRGERGAPGLATIYRTLAALAAAGEVDSLAWEGETRFRLCRDRHHHHLVCDSCGSVDEVEGAEVEAWVNRVTRRRGFAVRSHTADIFGLCRECR